MKNLTNLFCISSVNQPSAYAVLKGGTDYPALNGIVNFYTTPWHAGLMVEAEIYNMPNSTTYSPRFLGFHIHEYGDCCQNFENTGGHFNPTGADHPYHIGDLPPVLNSNGYGYQAFYDSFLSLDAIVGRSVILHGGRDDFRTQPSGDSGNKIACGVIKLTAIDSAPFA